MPNGGETALQSARFATIFLTHELDARINLCDTLNLGRGFVARAIIDHDDFNFAFVVATEKCPQSTGDYFSFVVGGNYDTNRSGKFRFR